MDYQKMTAPCGLDCFNCDFFLANSDEEILERVKIRMKEYNLPVILCKGCRAENGKIPLQKYVYGENHRCAAYECTCSKGIQLCSECDEFPCDKLHPYADKAVSLPHNLKVFNLCLIKKMGLEKWAKEKAASVREVYFKKNWSLD